MKPKTAKSRKKAAKTGRPLGARGKCGVCRKPGHNARTCKKG